MDDPDRSVIDKKHRALEIGRSFLGVGNGHIQRRNVAPETDEVVASVGEDPELLPTGKRLDQARSYCRRTVEADSPVALSNAAKQGWETDPAYEEHNLSCYLGTTIFVSGEVYGTVCFTDYEPREAEFTGAEKAFVELIARLLGREIEASDHSTRLEQHRERLEQKERERTRLETRYEALLELAPNAIFILDAETGDVLRANEKAAELTGYSAEELSEKHVLDLHPAGQQNRYRELFESTEETTSRERFDDGTQLTIERADATEVPVELSASVVEIEGQDLIHAIVRDISDRRKQEQELRIKNQAIEEASIGITIASATDENLPLVYANPEFERLTGYEREVVDGQNCRFLQGEQTDESALGTIREALAAREPVTTELLNYRADGSPFWNELTLAPVTGTDTDAVTHYIGFQQDVTARKRRDRSLAVLDRVLRHNLRNAMSVVDGFARVIAEETEGEIATMAERIGDTAGDITALSEKARELQLAMRDTTEPTPRDLQADVAATVDTLRPAYPDTEFQISQSDSAQVTATPRLRTALRELGENAATHGSPGPVTYEIERTDDGRVAVHITDNGSGLSERERRVIETGRETPLEHGDGLGLWLVNWIVTDVGGDVNTSVDGGTTVTVLLPPASETDGSYYRRKALSGDPD